MVRAYRHVRELYGRSDRSQTKKLAFFASGLDSRVSLARPFRVGAAERFESTWKKRRLKTLPRRESRSALD